MCGGLGPWNWTKRTILCLRRCGRALPALSPPRGRDREQSCGADQSPPLWAVPRGHNKHGTTGPTALDHAQKQAGSAAMLALPQFLRQNKPGPEKQTGPAPRGPQGARPHLPLSAWRDPSSGDVCPPLAAARKDPSSAFGQRSSEKRESVRRPHAGCPGPRPLS